MFQTPFIVYDYPFNRPDYKKQRLASTCHGDLEGIVLTREDADSSSKTMSRQHTRNKQGELERRWLPAAPLSAIVATWYI